MDDTDAVLVAGGDGTLMEAVTGLLRRKDINLVSRSLPLGLSAQYDAKGYITQCPRIDLNKSFLPRPKTTTA